MKLNTCFKFEEPINSYHAEWLIPSEPNLEVTSRFCLSVNPKETIFRIWRRRNNAFVNEDISSRSVVCMITHFSHTGVLVNQSFHAKDLFHYSIVQK